MERLLNMSEHRNLEAELFWELWKNTPDNMFVLRVEEGDIYVVNFNDPQLDALELTRGVPMREQVDPALFEAVMSNYQRCIEQRAAIQYEESESFSTGCERHWSTMLCPTLDEQGEVNYIFGIARDISEQKRIQAAAQSSAREAERANQVKMAFLASMSHEMRTPLNGIQSAVELLQDFYAPEAEKELLDMISASTEALTRLTSDILDYARIEAGQLTLEYRQFRLAELILDVDRLMRAQLDGKPVSLNWETDAVADLYGDAGRLKQILINLIGNAIKFTHQGEVEVRIRVLDNDTDPLLLAFEVADTGIGIAKGDVDSLFQPFSRLDRFSNRNIEGTGLGLAICKDLVESMGGQIRVASSEGEGSCFSFSLPFAKSLASTEPTISKSEREPIDLAGCSVLMVEDNLINQMVTAKLLERVGVRVSVAGDGADALAMCQQYQYDAVLMDWHMPVMSGLEATQRIRELHNGMQTVPVIGLTASAMDEDRQACLNAGMDEVITKPVNLSLLSQALRRLIGQRRSVSQTVS